MRMFHINQGGKESKKQGMNSSLTYKTFPNLQNAFQEVSNNKTFVNFNVLSKALTRCCTAASSSHPFRAPQLQSCSMISDEPLRANASPIGEKKEKGTWYSYCVVKNFFSLGCCSSLSKLCRVRPVLYFKKGRRNLRFNCKSHLAIAITCRQITKELSYCGGSQVKKERV